MKTTIKLKIEDGSDRNVKAVRRGDLAIHAQDVIAKETGSFTFALTHVPSGRQIDGLYLKAITLKTALRNLSRLDWSADVQAIRQNTTLRKAVIDEIKRIEADCHWAHRRNFIPSSGTGDGSD